MIKIRYALKDSLGLHARPAGALVKQAMKYPCKIKITVGQRSADAKRLISVMAMAVKYGESLEFTFEGEEEGKAADEMQVFLQENL